MFPTKIGLMFLLRSIIVFLQSNKSITDICILHTLNLSLSNICMISCTNLTNQFYNQNLELDKRLELDLESIMSSLRMDFEKEGISFQN